MIRSRFFWKLFAWYAGFILVGMTAAGFFLANRVRADALREIEAALHQKVALLREIATRPLRGDASRGLQERIRLLGAETSTRFTVIRPDGKVIADSDVDPTTMDDHSSRPEILDARDRGAGTVTRFSATTSSEMMYHALAVRDDDLLLGYVRGSLPTRSVDERLSRLVNIILAVAAGAVAVGMIFSFVLFRAVSGPLQSVTDAARAIAGGKSGERVLVEARDEIGDLARSFNTMAEKLEERIHVSSHERDQLLAILGGMVEGVIAVDEKARIVHINRAAGRILRVSLEESASRPALEVLRPRAIGDVFREALRRGGDLRREVRIPAGTTDRVVEIHAAPIRNGGAVVVLHDVTDLRQLESIRSDFVANVSHELKTPITIIKGIVETLLLDEKMPADVRTRFLGKVGHQTGRLSALVDDLLALAALESGAGRAERKAVDLRRVAFEAVEEMIPAADEKGVLLDLPPTSPPLRVMGGREELRRMVDNLLGNAVQYTPAGGRVTVTATPEGDSAVIEVRDEGIGIEPVHHERVFERFYRVDKARSRNLGGTGLGLAIVKHIVIAHEGSVSLKSVPGKGSVFTVKLPLLEP